MGSRGERRRERCLKGWGVKKWMKEGGEKWMKGKGKWWKKSEGGGKE